jgi:hypothetical protein
VPGSDFGSPDFSQITQPAPEDLRSGLAPGTSSSSDAIDRERGKGIYYVDSGSTSSGSAGSASSTPSPTPPSPWITTPSSVSPQGVKQADPDVVLFGDEPIGPELLLQLQYEDVAGIELINISRSDIVDGQNVSYSPVTQLSSLRRSFNSNNIIALPSTSSDIFSRFGIDLVLRGIRKPYFNDNGDLVIEIDQVLENEVIEAEVDTSGTINVLDYS